MKDEEWEMKDGNKIMVSDMSESHAKNCLKMLIRKINKFNERQRELREVALDRSIEDTLFELYMSDAGDR